MKPTVSVIVPTKNGKDSIERCLISIKNQSYSNVEIIVVDNNSKDNTRLIAQKYAKVFRYGPERSSQRNYGAKVAKGNYLFFIDVDMELPIKLIENCVKTIGKLDALRVEDNGIGIGFLGKCQAFEKSLYSGDRVVVYPRFVKKSVYLDVGGMDENLVFNEDLDLNERLKSKKCKIGYIYDKINHYSNVSFLEIIKKYFYYGVTSRQYFRKNKKQGTSLYAYYYPLLYLKNWRSFLRNPDLGAGLIIRKAIEYFVSFVGYLYSYII